MADAISIPQIVWKILNISPQILSQYRTVQDQLLWLIFIPSLVVIFFIYLFATRATGGHTGFRNLFGIAAYLTLVLTGWYGKLVPILNLYWGLLLGVALFLFIVNFFLPVGKSRERESMGGGLMKGGLEKAFERREYARKAKDIETALKNLGFNPNMEPTSQPNWSKLDDKAKAALMDYYKQLVEIKRKSKEWI